MKSNRRNFLKLSGLAGIGLVGGSMAKGFAAPTANHGHSDHPANSDNNMSGFAAPKLKTGGMGFIDLANAAPEPVDRWAKIKGVDIKAWSDFRPNRPNAA